VALIWRWTGDDRFRDEMYDFARRNLEVVDRKLDVDHDGWPEGSGNVERPGMGPEKLDNGVYYIRSLYDLADMARSKHDIATWAWARNLARRLQRQFEGTWWYTAAQQYADSLIDPGNVRSFQKHWIGQVPMEAELNRGDRTTPGVAARGHGVTALAGRENSCFSGDRPGSPGLFHTGCGGGAEGKGDFEIFSIGTAIQAVGEGNYGRLGSASLRRTRGAATRRRSTRGARRRAGSSSGTPRTRSDAGRGAPRRPLTAPLPRHADEPRARGDDARAAGRAAHAHDPYRVADAREARRERRASRSARGSAQSAPPRGEPLADRRRAGPGVLAHAPGGV
jgi:hypothetical protein